MGVEMLLQLGVGLDVLGHVDGAADDRAVAHRLMGEGERAALAGDDGEAARLLDLAGVARRRGEVVLGFLERGLATRARPRRSPHRSPRRRRGCAHTSDSARSRSHTGTGSASSMARKSSDSVRTFCSGSSHTAAMPPTARPRKWILWPLRSCALKREALGALAQAVERAAELDRVGAREARVDRRLRAAIGIGAGAVAAPDDQRFLCRRTAARRARPPPRACARPRRAARA